jgi:hypothetical protein
LPAIFKTSLISVSDLTAADGAHDVHLVLRLQARPAMLARHHIAVDRQRQRLARQLQRIDQLIQSAAAAPCAARRSIQSQS